MRQLIELGWVSANIFGKNVQFNVIYVDDIQFILPVDLGNIVKFVA